MEIKNKKYLEVIFFVFCLALVLFSGIYMKDNVLSIVCSLCGILYTIISGKGKTFCYVFGLIGTSICAYLSFRIGLTGNFILHAFYYLPLEIIGFFSWRQHIQKDTKSVIKEKIANKYRAILTILSLILALALGFVFDKLNNPSPVFDSLLTSFSIIAMILTVRRYIEQWIFWTLANIVSIFLWFSVFIQGEGIFCIFLVRILYLMLGIYFYVKWRTEITHK